jgi:hypothetical protein
MEEKYRYLESKQASTVQGWERRKTWRELFEPP